MHHQGGDGRETQQDQRRHRDEKHALAHLDRLGIAARAPLQFRLDRPGKTGETVAVAPPGPEQQRELDGAVVAQKVREIA